MRDSARQAVDMLVDDFRTSIRRPDGMRPIVHKAFGCKAIELAIPKLGEQIEHEQVEQGRLSFVAKIRVQEILVQAAARVLVRLGRRATLPMKEAFERAIVAQCDKIISAAKVNPQKQEERRLRARASLAKELQEGRLRLSGLRRKIALVDMEVKQAAMAREERIRVELSKRSEGFKVELAKRVEDFRVELANKLVASCSAQGTLLQALFTGYDPVPAPVLTPHPEGLGLPAESGIYFLWLDESVDYVGRAKRLCQRLRLGQHHILKADHKISYLAMDYRQLTWAECYYIGLTKAPQNFGASATHSAHGL